jgi:hypothetical protein
MLTHCQYYPHSCDTFDMTGPQLLAVLVQGVYGFEWVMAEAHKQGLLTDERPILCKPMHQVRQESIQSQRGCRILGLSLVLYVTRLFT